MDHLYHGYVTNNQRVDFLTILKNDGVRQWVSDDIPYMKWKIKLHGSSHHQPVFSCSFSWFKHLSHSQGLRHRQQMTQVTQDLLEPLRRQNMVTFQVSGVTKTCTRPGKHTDNYGKSPFFYGKTHYKLPFSIAMLVYQRVKKYMLKTKRWF